ncbi:MAG: sensor histidine kinase [Limisphaerales bacterium]
MIKRLRLLLQRGETTREAIEINDVVGEVLRIIRGDLIGRRITVLTVLGPELPQVTGDRSQLQQVLLNLLIHACDAVDMVPAGMRVVTLRTSAQDGGVRAAVSDQGGGLPAEAEALFEPFNTTKRNGLGMGLAICRMIVNAHGGRVWAEPGPGQGATFHLSLPAANRNS